jgi:hypothetical protein
MRRYLRGLSSKTIFLKVKIWRCNKVEFISDSPSSGSTTSIYEYNISLRNAFIK